jgi:hypothetical protein
MNRSTLRIALRWSTFLVSAPLLLACSGGEEREYTIPEEICDARIDPELLEPLLPPGGEFEDADDVMETPVTCGISIDSQQELTMVLYVTNSYTDPVESASNNRLSDETVPADIAGDGALWQGEHTAGAESSFRCVVEEGNPFVPEGGSYGHVDLNVPGSMNIEDEEERMQRIEDFARNYVAGLQEMVGCGA